MVTMLLGPVIGLGFSTLLGAIGMGQLGEAMAGSVSPQLLRGILAGAYSEISYAYFMMVGGTLPLFFGPLVVLLARRFEQSADLARGGDHEELTLLALNRIQDGMERLVQLKNLEAEREVAPYRQVGGDARWMD